MNKNHENSSIENIKAEEMEYYKNPKLDLPTDVTFEGAALSFWFCCGGTFGFQLTRPLRGATVLFGLGLAGVIFQLTRPSQGAT